MCDKLSSPDIEFLEKLKTPQGFSFKNFKNTFALLSTLNNNESALHNFVSRSNSQSFLSLGNFLIQYFQQNSLKNKAYFTQDLHQFLDFARKTPVLQKIYLEQRTTDWFNLIHQILLLSNFHTGNLFYQRAEQYAHKPLFYLFRDGHLIKITWSQVKEYVENIVQSLLVLSEGNKELKVAILSENCLNMAYCDLACLTHGFVDILIPANLTASEINYILNHSEAHILFVSNVNQLQKIQINNHLNKTLKYIVLFNSEGAPLNDKILDFETFLNLSKKASNCTLSELREAINLHDLATIMYTSGTTELPKGIMFSHLNIVSKRFARALALPDWGSEDIFLCYLPLYHTFGRWFELMGCVFWGSIYVFAEKPAIDTLLANMQLVKPTVFISIPKKWMQIYEKVCATINIEHASHSEIKEILHRLTGGHLKWGLSAAGYLDPDIFKFFQKYGIELMSGFGMTEATGGITMTPPFHYRENSVGKALPGIEIKLDEDGEMLIRGPYVMRGYYKSSQSFFENGWLRTGDIFARSPDGYYEILDRKKEIYKNTKGETIAPQKIENMFRDFESVKSVFLVGDHREYNTLLIYPNYESNELNLKKLDPRHLREYFSSLIVSVNKFLAPYERIVDFKIIHRDFNSRYGELTPKGTFKRKVVEQNFKKEIQDLYDKKYASIKYDQLEIRIPNWYLRKHGFTAKDFTVERSFLINKITRRQCRIKYNHRTHTITLGYFNYKLITPCLNLGDIIVSPVLWLGNQELIDFLGKEILFTSGYKSQENSPVGLAMNRTRVPFDAQQWQAFQYQDLDTDLNLEILNQVALGLFAPDRSLVQSLLKFLENQLQHSKEWHQLIHALLLRTCYFSNRLAQRHALMILIRSQKRFSIKYIFRYFLDNSPLILDKKTIEALCDLQLEQEQLQEIFAFLDEYVHDVPNQHKRIHALFQFLAHYGIRHPLWFKSVRAQLVKYILASPTPQIKHLAQQNYDWLLKGFRAWLGNNQTVAIDPDSGLEYNWQDVIVFDENVKAKNKNRLSQALTHLPVIREALFIFTKGTLLNLQDIALKGVRISHLGTHHGKSVYRLAIQTRYLGTFDIAVNLNQSLSQEEINSEILWLIHLGSDEFQEPLVEDFGGYWPEFGLWTEEFIPGETVEKFLNRLNRYEDVEWVERMQLLWPYLVWSGVAAYIDFWNRTQQQLVIADPTPANVIVPSHDYQVGSRIVSISKRKPFENILKMISNFLHYFVYNIENKYNKLKGYCPVDIIFSSFMEILGEKEGLNLLENLIEGHNSTVSKSELEIIKQLKYFIQQVKNSGFLPKRLHFAIQRYLRWLSLNPRATAQARLDTVQELWTTYRLDTLEKDFPGVRIQLFRDTVFKDAGKPVQNRLNDIVQKLKEHALADDEIVDTLLTLKDLEPLSSEMEFYLTRMTYPHLSSSDSAEILSVIKWGSQKSDVVVYFEDKEGQLLRVRQPVTHKEVARLYRLFLSANLPVEFSQEHHFLVVVDEKGQVIGGLFYRFTGSDSAHMEKMVIEEHHRKKGIGEGLLKEFFNRLRNHGVKAVTVGFLQPAYFHRFGFNIDHRYAGMVKYLTYDSSQDWASEEIQNI